MKRYYKSCYDTDTITVLIESFFYKTRNINALKKIWKIYKTKGDINSR